MADWLMIRPVFDEVTEITFDEAQDVLNYFEEKGIEYIDLAKDKATKENVEKVLRENPNIKIAHYDHGNETSWIGSDEKPCVSTQNVNVLKGRECYCNNCSSAKKLGVEAWKLKAIYWGYTEVFVFTTDAKEEFKQFVNHGIKRRVDGYSRKKCLEMTKNLANKLIDKLVKAGKGLAASCLRWDRDHLVCYTEDMPPEETDCPARKLAIKIFGSKIGWKLSRTFPFSIAFFFLGLGILLHDYFDALWHIGGYKEILSLQGGYFGAAILVAGFLFAYYQVWSILKKS